MNEIIKLNDVEDKILTLRGQNILLDSDVAALYGVETKHINQAVSRNPAKFPEGYVFLCKVLIDNNWSQIVTGSKTSNTQQIQLHLPKRVVICWQLFSKVQRQRKPQST